MILAGATALLMLVFGGGQERRPPPAQGTVSVRHQQIIIRVPSGARQLAPAGASLIQWRESRGPRCVAASRLVGATLLRENSVDLILRGNSRIRARLQSSCP